MGRGKRVLRAMALLVLAGAAAFVTYEACKVRRIDVVGCESLSADAVAALSGIEYGQSVFFLDKPAAMGALAQEPFLKPVAVDIAYPDKVVLTIRERLRAACIEKDGALLVIDDECWLLEVREGPQSAYPLVTGLPADAVQVGRRLGSRDTFKLDALSRVLTALYDFGLAPKSVDIAFAANIVLEMPDGMKIELGDDTQLEDKLARVCAYLADREQTGNAGGTLNVAALDKAYYKAGGDEN